MFNLQNSDYKNPFYTNLGKKTAAVFITIILWTVANIESDIERNIQVPLNFVNLKNSLIIVNNPPENIDLRIRGSRSKLASFANSNITVNLDLSDYKSGNKKVEIKREDINVPRGVQLITISPVHFGIEIDKLISKRVDVKALVDNPDKGYEIINPPKIEPPTVKVNGPEKLLRNMNEISTTKISLEGEKSKFTIQVPIQIPSPLIELSDEQLAKITVDINEINLKKEFKNIEINLKNFENINYEINSDLKVDLIFDGPYNLINELKSEDIEVFLNADNIKKTSSKIKKLKIDVNYPNSESINLTKISPKSVNIKIN